MAKMSIALEEAIRKAYVMAREYYEVVAGFKCPLLANGIRTEECNKCKEHNAEKDIQCWIQHFRILVEMDMEEDDGR